MMDKQLLAQADLSINLDDLLRAVPFQAGEMGAWSSLTIGGIISTLLRFVFVLAGLALFIFLIIGGFQLMTSAGDPKGMESGQKKVMYAVVGFIIIFASFWLVQILQVVFGLPKIF